MTDNNTDDNADNNVCRCSFPKFHICDGLQVCRRCGKVDHYKNGIVADWSDDEDV